VTLRRVDVRVDSMRPCVPIITTPQTTLALEVIYFDYLICRFNRMIQRRLWALAAGMVFLSNLRKNTYVGALFIGKTAELELLIPTRWTVRRLGPIFVRRSRGGTSTACPAPQAQMSKLFPERLLMNLHVPANPSSV